MVVNLSAKSAGLFSTESATNERKPGPPSGEARIRPQQDRVASLAEGGAAVPRLRQGPAAPGDAVGSPAPVLEAWPHQRTWRTLEAGDPGRDSEVRARVRELPRHTHVWPSRLDRLRAAGCLRLRRYAGVNFSGPSLQALCEVPYLETTDRLPQLPDRSVLLLPRLSARIRPQVLRRAR